MYILSVRQCILLKAWEQQDDFCVFKKMLCKHAMFSQNSPKFPSYVSLRVKKIQLSREAGKELKNKMIRMCYLGHSDNNQDNKNNIKSSAFS